MVLLLRPAAFIPSFSLTEAGSRKAAGRLRPTNARRLPISQPTGRLKQKTRRSRSTLRSRHSP